ncbi:M50 family metallopeptidase [Hirschia baltica]|uniref:Peptidase M50 n=1 Tax=Hirschia baltica (strain ATCC 49814 / DSM 5838 / IFAM 1418) TaxID=582402 RepID=C6XJV3_HIRBI|nr:M50 family metallopeptidase [Hirschia baltica]ACT59398.1 peptidase M50 [Hirschia baltica ATCC 49814]
MDVLVSQFLNLFSIVSSVVPFIIMIGVVVTIHELGHYYAGRAFGAAVESFAFGFGKSIFEVSDKRNTRWRLNWLPLGGFVKFVGEQEGDNSISDNPKKPKGRYYKDLAAWQRVIVSMAGPVANFILAILIYAVIFSQGKPLYGDVTVENVLENSAAYEAGVLDGDIIVAADDRAVSSAGDVIEAVAYSADEPVKLSLLRNGEEIDLIVIPRREMFINERLGIEDEIGRIGVSMSSKLIAIEDVSTFEAVSLGADQTANVIRKTLKVLNRLIFGKDNFDKMRGPLGMGDIADRVVDSNMKRTDIGFKERLSGTFWQMLELIAMFSVSIGFFNLLPIPMLDGYSALLGLYETVVGSEVSLKFQEYLLRGGLAVVGVFFIAVTWNDIRRLGLLDVFSGLLS